MRRSARVLSATALVGAVMGAVAPAASGEPAAEVGPRAVAPGGTVTVSVSCDPAGGPPPETIEARSHAFEQGTVTLHRIAGSGDRATGQDPVTGRDPTTQHNPAAGLDPVAGNDPGADRGSAASQDPAPGGVPAARPESVPGQVPGPQSAVGLTYRGTARISPTESLKGGEADARSSERSVDGTCPAALDGPGKQWSATFTVSGGDQHGKEPHGDPSHAPTWHPDAAQHGVHAGRGGAFTDSVPALAAGGLLIAGGIGAAAQRLLRRRPARYR